MTLDGAPHQRSLPRREAASVPGPAAGQTTARMAPRTNHDASSLCFTATSTRTVPPGRGHAAAPRTATTSTPNGLLPPSMAAVPLSYGGMNLAPPRNNPHAMPQAPVLPLVTRPSSPTNPAQDAPDHVPSMALTGSQRTPKKQQGAKKSKRKTMGTDHKSSPRNKKSRSSGGTTTSSETASTSFARPTKPTTMKQSEVPIFSRLPSRPEPTTLVKPNPLTLPTGGPAPGISALPPAAAPYVVVVEKHYHHHAGLAPPLYASSVPQGLEPQGTTPPATDVHYRLVPVPSTTTTTTVPQALSSSLYDPQFEMRALSHLAANGSLLPSGFPAHASSLYAAPALAAATEGLTPTAAPHTTLTQTMVHPPSSQVPPPQPPSWNTHHKTSDASSWSAEPHRNRTRDARVGLPLTRGSLVQPPPPHATDSGLQPLPPRLPVPRTRTTSASSSSGPEIITIDDDDSDHEEEPRVPSPQGSSVHGTTTVKPNPQEKEPSAAAAAIASSLSKNAKRNTKKNKDSSTVEVTSKRLEEILQKHDETTKTDKSKHMVVERKRSNSPISDITNNDILTGVRRGRAFDHPGNRLFQNMAREFHDFYIEARSNIEKAAVANFLVEAVHKRGGRFLRRQDREHDLSEGVSYVELSPDEARQRTRDVLIRHCKGKR